MASRQMIDWMKHMQGMSRLISNCSPELFSSDTGRSILEMSRFGVAIVHSIRRTRCFLERPEWMTIPWINDPTPRDVLNRITDIHIQLGGVNEDVDRLMRNMIVDQEQEFCASAAVELQHAALIAKFQSLLKDLSKLRIQWDIMHPGACFEVPVSPQEHNSLFESAIHFHNLRQGNEMVMYDAILLILLGESSRVLEPLTAQIRREALMLALAEIEAEAHGEAYGSTKHDTTLDAQTTTSNNLSDKTDWVTASMEYTANLDAFATAFAFPPSPSSFHYDFDISGSANPALLHPTLLPTPKSIVIELARVMPYHLQPQHSFQTSFLVAYGLRVIYLVFQRIWMVESTNLSEPSHSAGAGLEHAYPDDVLNNENKSTGNESAGMGTSYDPSMKPVAFEHDAWTQARVNEWLDSIGRQMADMSGFETYRGLFTTAFTR